jgi:hypothetical protein
VGKIDDRIGQSGLVLPQPLVPPPGVTRPFRSVHVVGSVAYIAGHGPQSPSGELAGPFGKVGLDLDVTQGYAAARLTALSILASLRRTLGDLDRIAVWGRVFGMVNSAPGFTRAASSTLPAAARSASRCGQINPRTAPPRTTRSRSGDPVRPINEHTGTTRSRGPRHQP